MTRIRQSGEATVQQRMDGGAVKLSTFIPLQIRKRGVRKVVIRPDGESSSSTARGQFDSPMLVALARAFYWLQLLDEGVVASGTDIAQREGLAPLDGERTPAPDPAGAGHHPGHPGGHAAALHEPDRVPAQSAAAGLDRAAARGRRVRCVTPDYLTQRRASLSSSTSCCSRSGEAVKPKRL